MADLKALEHPTLKVPYETLNKRFRNCQKTIDREVSHVVQVTSDLEKCLENKTANVGTVVNLLDSMVDKLTVLKRKASSLQAVEAVSQEEDSARVCKRRLEHLKEYDRANGSALAQWKKKRVDRMLVEYFLRAGYYETAVKLARHSNIEDLTNIELFLVAKEVEESLLRRETSSCLAWCHDNKSKLRKIKSTLEFNLRTQEFIELIHLNRRLEAVRHARKYFSQLEKDQLAEIQNVMGLLAFPMDTNLKQYREMLDGNRWQRLVDQFREENYKLYQLNSTPVLTLTLEAGLASMKTPHCYNDITKNADCPVCSKNLNELARNLPFAHCAQSRLVCSISGQIMNEHNPPMMLPNGHVYGEGYTKFFPRSARCRTEAGAIFFTQPLKFFPKGQNLFPDDYPGITELYSPLPMMLPNGHVYGEGSLTTMAAENEGKVVCPKTKEEFAMEQLDKVFIM